MFKNGCTGHFTCGGYKLKLDCMYLNGRCPKLACSQSDDAPVSKEEKRGEDVPTEVSDEYQALLAEAETTDFSDLEHAQIIKTGTDLSGTPVIIFIPRLGFHDSHDSESQLRRMLLLFIKKAHRIVSRQYVFVYDHMQFSILSQHPLIYRTYSMLPREYKKNILKMYVIHPTFFIRIFFEQGVKRFVSQKFYNKLKFVDSITELQLLIMPLGASLPPAYLQRGDSKYPSSKPIYDPRYMPPLEVTFNPSLGTTDLIHQCISFLSTSARLQTKGLFRLAGDQAVLDLARVRLFGRNDSPSTVIIGHDAYLEMAQLSPDKPPFSALVVDDIHTVTSILSMSLRHLPETLITPSVHECMLGYTKKLEHDNDENEWHACVTPLLASMPECHTKTFHHLLRFLARVSLESGSNEMTVENISRVFAPSLFPEKPIDSSNPMLAYAEVQLQKVILIQLITKHIRDEESILAANIKVSSRMASRLERNSPSDEEYSDEEYVQE